MGSLGANVQGELHIAVPLGRKKKIKKAASSLYVCRPVLNAEDIIAWAKSNGFEKTVTPDDMHVTIAYSRTPIEWPEPDKQKLTIIPNDPTLARFGAEGDCVVLKFGDGLLKQDWQRFINAGASWDWPGFSPHVTLSYSGNSDIDLDSIEPYDGLIILGPEEFAEVNEGWKDTVVEKVTVDGADDMDLTEAEQLQKRGARNNSKDAKMIQQMHDHSVSLGAKCDDAGYAEDYGKVARIAKIDESLGLVFGYAIVCTKNGQPYYDLNIDKAKDGTYKRVPEHIPDAAMLKAAVDFMQTARVGNEMHDGPDVGQYVFAFPLTADIAKAFGINTSTTGLMIAYKPPPEVFAKFKDGTYTGFSIEGSRVKSVETDE